jgi:hypothetical protein
VAVVHPFSLLSWEPTEVNAIVPFASEERSLIGPRYAAVREGLLGHHIRAMLTIEWEIFLYASNFPSDRWRSQRYGGWRRIAA